MYSRRGRPRKGQGQVVWNYASDVKFKFTNNLVTWTPWARDNLNQEQIFSKSENRVATKMKKLLQIHGGDIKSSCFDLTTSEVISAINLLTIAALTAV